MKFLAAILIEQDRPLVIEELETPPLRFGQVLVRVLCSGVCGSQLGEIYGVKGPDPWLPHLLGHEGCGVVLECGEGVSTVQPGNRVVLHWRLGAGLAASMPRYRSASLDLINAGGVTTFNELAVVSENRVTRVPDDFDPEWAALLGCAVTTGMGVVNNNAGLRIGESLVVWGAGGIGLSIVQAGSLAGGYPIVAIDRFSSRLELAKSLGATHTVLATEGLTPQEIADSIREIVGQCGSDVVIENTGQVDVIRGAYDLTAAEGRTVLVGVPRHDRAVCLKTLPLHFGKTLTGSHGGESTPHRDIPRLVKLCLAGRLSLGVLITNRYPLSQINQALEAMREGSTAGRVIIQMPESSNHRHTSAVRFQHRDRSL